MASAASGAALSASHPDAKAPGASGGASAGELLNELKAFARSMLSGADAADPSTALAVYIRALIPKLLRHLPATSSSSSSALSPSPSSSSSAATTAVVLDFFSALLHSDLGHSSFVEDVPFPIAPEHVLDSDPFAVLSLLLRFFPLLAAPPLHLPPHSSIAPPTKSAPFPQSQSLSAASSSASSSSASASAASAPSIGWSDGLSPLSASGTHCSLIDVVSALLLLLHSTAPPSAALSAAANHPNASSALPLFRHALTDLIDLLSDLNAVHTHLLSRSAPPSSSSMTAAEPSPMQIDSEHARKTPSPAPLRGGSPAPANSADGSASPIHV
jgi:hypothetical protein